MNLEIWADIPGWKGFYQASSEGRVRSLDRTILQVGRWGPRSRIMKGRILKPAYCTNGYTFVALSRPGQSPKAHLVHRLVALAFLGYPNPSQEVRHLNGVRDDNRLLNIKCGSRSENHADKLIHGTHARGERNPQAKLTSAQVREIRASALPQSQLSDTYGVCVPTISEIKSHKSWAWLDSKPLTSSPS